MGLVAPVYRMRKLRKLVRNMIYDGVVAATVFHRNG